WDRPRLCEATSSRNSDASAGPGGASGSHGRAGGSVARATSAISERWSEPNEGPAHDPTIVQSSPTMTWSIRVHGKAAGRVYPQAHPASSNAERQRPDARSAAIRDASG